MKLKEIVEMLKGKGFEEEEIKKMLLELKVEIEEFCKDKKVPESEEEYMKRVFGI